MPNSDNSFASPMPDSINNWGVFTAPAQSTTSRAARTVCLRPLASSNSTPTARLPSKITRRTVESVSRVRFERYSTGLR